jgi:hypothetical protein
MTSCATTRGASAWTGQAGAGALSGALPNKRMQLTKRGIL